MNNLEKEIENLKTEVSNIKQKLETIKTLRPEPKIFANTIKKALKTENHKIVIHYKGLNGKEGTIITWGYYNDQITDEGNRIMYGNKINPHEIRDENDNHMSVSLKVTPRGIRIFYKCKKGEPNIERDFIYWSQITTIDT